LFISKQTLVNEITNIFLQEVSVMPKLPYVTDQLMKEYICCNFPY